MIRLVYKHGNSWIGRQFPGPLCIMPYLFHLSRPPSWVENSKKGRIFNKAGLFLTQLISDDRAGSQKFYLKISVFVEEKFNGAEGKILGYE